MDAGQTLTRADQVFEVLAEGGYVRRGSRAGLLRLLDKDGNEVNAWQTAIRNGSKRHTQASIAVARTRKEAR